LRFQQLTFEGQESMPVPGHSLNPGTGQKTDRRQIALGIWTTMKQSEMWSHCASVGFFGFLSVFPVLAIFVMVYGLAFSPSEMEAQFTTLRHVLPDSVYQLLDAQLKELASSAVSHLTIGLVCSTLVTLYMGSRGVKYLILMLNSASHKPPSHGFLDLTLLAVALTLGALLLFIFCLAALALLPLLAAHLPFPTVMERLALWGRWPILMAVIFVSFLVLYRFGPDGVMPVWRALVPGAALATVLWLVLSVGFSYYVSHFSHYSVTFGALSAGVVLMLWIYYSAFIIALGAAFNGEIARSVK
jgi:membrane protein